MLHVSVVFILLLRALCIHAQGDCVEKDYDNDGTVCVCNSEVCDTVPAPAKVDQGQYLVYTSNRAGLRFHQDSGEFSSTKNADNQILINASETYQKILGWGGAFTDATGINILSLEERAQEKLLRSYFSEDGIEYSLCRVPIGGTDFSTHGYSYDDGDEDPELENFALAEEDSLYKIPFIKKAFELTNNNLQLFASAWTAPKWMKTNGEYAGYGFLKEEMYQSWANYFVKFLDSYEEEGISFWGLTTGNEPHSYSVPDIKINNVGWNASEMGRWIANNLGPAVRESAHSDIKIMTLDDQRMYLPSFVDDALNNETARGYIDGVAVHWYTDMFLPPSLLTKTHEHFPELFILGTEACIDTHVSQAPPVVLGSWKNGEDYASDIIEDLQNWVGGWIDWNMALDLTGGPTYINNLVDSPIIVNKTAGQFYKQPTYYNLGHFSKFIPRDSLRIDAVAGTDLNIGVVAFQKPDNGTVIVIQNRNNETIPISIVDESRGTIQHELSERSITTILYW